MQDFDESVYAAALEPGDRILDRYVIRERIANGGHSLVYRGDDERLARPVCIKLFHKLTEETGVRRTSYEHFVQEAFALSKLAHPNTLRIFDFGYLPLPDGEQGPPFQVSEYMSGGTLSARVKVDGPFRLTDARSIVVGLCGALAEAHENGLIHRDIKPKNILFGHAGSERVVKLADFGIAKLLPAPHELVNRAGDTVAVAGKNLLMFSPSWASPEQMVGSKLGPLADVYSLGLVITFMLTGQVVFRSQDPQESYRHRKKAERRFREAFDHTYVPVELADLLIRACSFRPAGRPTDARAFCDEFTRVCGDEPSGRSARIPLPAPPPEARTQPRATPPRPPPGSRTRESQRGPGVETVAGSGVSGAMPPVRISAIEGDREHPLGDRIGRLVPLRSDTADVDCAGGRARLRLSLIPGAGDSRLLHVIGLDCFVARDGGRPSPAVQFARAGTLQIVNPARKPLAEASVSPGKPAAGHTIFDVGGRSVALSLDDHPYPLAVDFGPGAECLFVFADKPGGGNAR